MGWWIVIGFALVWWVTYRRRTYRPTRTYRSTEQRRTRAIALGRDPQRSASAAQRRIMWRRQNGLCAYCGWPMEAGQRIEAHHLEPWCRGGRTVCSNMVLIHAEPCHAQVTRSQHWT